MGVVEDIRQVIQDLVAPQLTSLDTRMNALDARIASIETSITQRFASAESVAQARHETTTAQIEALRETTTAQIEALRETTAAQIESLRDVLTAQIGQLAGVVSSNHASIQQKLDLDKRVERIETFQAARFELARPVGQQESPNP